MKNDTMCATCELIFDRAYSATCPRCNPTAKENTMTVDETIEAIDLATHTPPSTLELLYNHVEMKADEAKEQIEAFATNLSTTNDPVYAFEWSEGTLRAVGNLSCFRTVLRDIETMRSNDFGTDDEILARLNYVVADEAVRRGANLPSSSSLASNLTHSFVNAAWSNFARDLKIGWIGR